jgi:hypothetical protein
LGATSTTSEPRRSACTASNSEAIVVPGPARAGQRIDAGRPAREVSVMLNRTGGVARDAADHSERFITDNIELGVSYLFNPTRYVSRARVSTLASVRHACDSSQTPLASAPEQHPLAADWVEALDEVMASLQECTTRAAHVYGAHLHDCPWCARVRRGLGDPFARVEPTRS